MRKRPPRGPHRLAVIVGNGSSLDEMPSAFWRRVQAPDVLLVGTNRVLAHHACRGVRWDVLVVRDLLRQLWVDQRVGRRYADEKWNPSPAWKIGPAHARFDACDEYVRFAQGWQPLRRESDGEAVVVLAGTVVLMAANWAWWQGPERIVLAGVDYADTHARLVRGYDEPRRGQDYDRPIPACLRRKFREAREATGGAIFNASPRTELPEIPRAPWSDLL